VGTAEGLKTLIDKRLRRASSFYTVLILLVFGILFFATACMQMDSATAFSVEDPVLRAHLGNLDAASYTVNMPHGLPLYLSLSLTDSLSLSLSHTHTHTHTHIYDTYIRIDTHTHTHTHTHTQTFWHG
jgi:hypothetical protein